MIFLQADSLRRGLMCLTSSLTLMAGIQVEPAADQREFQTKSAVWPAVPLESSVLLLDQADYDLAPERMTRVIGDGLERVNIVVTLHCDVALDDKLSSMGIVRRRPDGGADYHELTHELVARLTRELRKAVQVAVDQKVDLVILAHLDANGRRERWRNYFDFDPTAEIAGHSYEQAMLQMILAALDVTADGPIQVEFNLAGEMGTSIFAHADRYHTILRRLRASRPDIRFGFNLNHNGVAGNWKPDVGDAQQVQSLIHACDFIGFSNYQPVSVPPTRQDFQNALENFVRELKQHGIVLPSDLPIHFSEVAIGGSGGDGRAREVAAVAAAPYAGPTPGSKHPWDVSELRQLRRQYHRALLDFLAQPTGSHQVTGAFLWSSGTFDPLNPNSTRNYDEEIAQAVRRHNQRVYAR